MGLVLKDQKESAIKLMDSILVAWPDPNSLPFSLVERFLIELSLSRFDSAIMWYSNSERCHYDYYHPLTDPVFLDQMIKLLPNALMVKEFRLNKSLSLEDSTFIEYLRKRYFFERWYSSGGNAYRGKSKSAEANNFLSQFPQTRFRKHMEPFIKEYCFESRFRPGIGFNVSFLSAPFLQFVKPPAIIVHAYWVQDGDRFSYSFGVGYAMLKLRKAYYFEGTLFPSGSPFQYRMFMAEGRYRFPSERIRNHNISVSGGMGRAEFAISGSKKEIRDSVRKGTSCFDFSVGYRLETGFGWVEDYDN